MEVFDLIEHYRKVKSLHSPLPKSLQDKLIHIEHAFGVMDAATSGSDFAICAKNEWGHLEPGTVKRYIVQLRAIMNRAERDGLIDRAPMIDAPYVNDTIYVDITSAEVKSLLDYIEWTEAAWYPLALLLTHTGARLGEALSLKPSSFSHLGTRISKPVGRRSKTIERVVPYTPRLHKMVYEGRLFRGGRLVPEGIADKSVPCCLGRVIDNSTAALGMQPLRVHDLRHAFAAMLAENGADLADIMTALGQSSPAMAARYRGLVRSRLNGITAAFQ